MITIMGVWEAGWLNPRVELFMWRQLINAYTVDRFIMVPKLLKARTSVEQFEDVGDALATCEGEVVVMDPKGDAHLSSLATGIDRTYVFGNAVTNHLWVPGKKVAIPTPSSQDLFAINAAAIVLAYEHG